MVLAEYGGDTDRARCQYKETILAEVSEGREIKEQVIGQSILGGDNFIAWAKEKYIERTKDREQPSVKEIHRYRSKDDILRVIKNEIRKDVQAIRAEKGELRQIVIDLLYRTGGFKGPQIGRIFGVGYGSVSQERMRLREKFPKDRKLQPLMSRIENSLSTSEI